MKIGRVINNIWATRKDEGLIGVKLLIVQLLDQPGLKEGSIIVAGDIIGAGIGEKVLVTEGIFRYNESDLGSTAVCR